MLKPIYILLGTISLGFGIIGIIVPGLPTTPFLLLTAGLYLRSSEKLYNRLINSKHFGPYIKNFSGGMNKKTKVIALLIMWVMILVSAFLFINNWTIRIILLSVGIIGSILMYYVVPTIEIELKHKI